MSEPLNIPYQLEHYLNFISDSMGMVRIDEPIYFDASNFIIEQDKNRYGRDVSFAGEESDFTFVSIPARYGHAFDKLIEYDKIYGFESEVEYLLKDSENDEYYLVGTIDFQNKQTDQTKEFSCKFIQSTSQAILKRRNDVKVDLFSDTDLDGEAITPVQTSGILIKAKPLVQGSELRSREFSYTGQFFGSQTIAMFPVFNEILRYDIENTLIPLEQVYQAPITQPFLEGVREDTQILLAQEDLTDIEINITGLTLSANWDGILDISKKLYVIYGDSYVTGEFTTITLEETEDRAINLVNQDYTVNIDAIPRGGFLGILFTIFDPFSTPSATPTSSGGFNLTSGDISISVTSTAIDSVTNGVRLIDAIKQTSKSINQDFVIDSPRIDIGGEWYDNFVFDGNMIRGRTSPFIYTWKAISNGLQEFHSDYEIEGNTIFVGKYDDFYTNTDMGAFLIAPDDTFRTSYNERFAINRFNFKYKDFNQDKDDDNTIDGVHTETEWLLQNKQVENYKDIEIDYIRDPFMLETTRKKSVSTKPTTSLSQDDKVFILDVVPLAPSARGGFSAGLTHYVNGSGQLQLLNDSSFNWALLGFGLGDTFTIETTSNSGTYEVIETENNIITLEPISASPTIINLQITKVSYPLSRVQYTNRTNEGFDRVENVDSPDKFANLLYTPKRNILNNWSSYLKTASKYKPLSISNTYFKNGGELLTQFNGGEVITENATIEQSDLQDAILTPEIINTRVLCDFSEYRAFAQALKTDRGFIRIYDNNLKVRKIYPQKVDYMWAKNEMSLTGEVKFESETTTIIKKNGIYTINEVGYPEDIVPQLEYTTENDYIQLFDAVTRPLINKTRYDFISVNGNTYNSIIELTSAITAL